MHRRTTLTLFLVIPLILSLGGIDIAEGKYKISREDTKVKLNLIAPESSIQNSKFFYSYRSNDDEVIGTCDRDRMLLQQALANGSMGALKMLDASSKIPSGILEGNVVDLGMYDECVAVREKISDVEISGRHCMYTADFTLKNQSVRSTLSICMPASCGASDVKIFIGDLISSIVNWENFRVNVTSVSCSPVDVNAWNDAEFVIFLCIFVVYVGFLIGCSVYDAMFELEDFEVKADAPGIIRQLSLQRNAAAILSTKVKPNSLPAIHGLRVFSMAWVVLGHEFVLNFSGVNVNAAYVLEWMQSWKSLYIFTAPFAVDTFFTVSGFLMTYLFLKQMPKVKNFNVSMYYVHRYVRLTPSVIALLIFSIVFVPKFGSGARWNTMTDMLAGKCSKKWWSILLYLQNFIDTNNSCLAHLWYLAVDMQLFWISPIILYPLYKIPKIGLAITTLLLCSSLVVTALIIGINKYPLVSFTQLHNMQLTSNAFQEVYEMPYVRAGPWLIGIFLGFEIVNRSRNFNKKTIWTGWLSTVVALSFCIFGTRYFMEPNYHYNVILETFFATVSRPIWAFGISWIIYACVHGHAGPIIRILSWKGFLPLSRLSYCTYLVHFVIQTMHSASLRSPSYFSDYFVWRKFLSDLVISIVVAFFFSLLFESPILVLEKKLLRTSRK